MRLLFPVSGHSTSIFPDSNGVKVKTNDSDLRSVTKPEAKICFRSGLSAGGDRKNMLYNILPGLK
jgi:hypothetical protein